MWSVTQQHNTYKNKLFANLVAENGPTAITLTPSAPGSGSKQTRVNDGFYHFEHVWSHCAGLGLGETIDAGGAPNDAAVAPQSNTCE